MDCPLCQADTCVTESRRRDAGFFRRRKCLNCGYRFSTLETPIVKTQPAQPIAQLAKTKYHRDMDGDGFESWLTIIATNLPPSIAKDVNLGELRHCFESGMRISEALPKMGIDF